MKVFISYRRSDNPFAATLIRDRLSKEFGAGSVYFDIDSIPLGVDFTQHIENAVASCDVLLVVMGDRWLAVDEDGRQRLQSPTDFVRIEIESALDRGVPVVPVPVGGARLPRPEELPEAIRALAFRNSADVPIGTQFEGGMLRLVRGLRDLALAGEQVEPSPAPTKLELPGVEPEEILPSVREEQPEADAAVSADDSRATGSAPVASTPEHDAARPSRPVGTQNDPFSQYVYDLVGGRLGLALTFWLHLVAIGGSLQRGLFEVLDTRAMVPSLLALSIVCAYQAGCIVGVWRAAIRVDSPSFWTHAASMIATANGVVLVVLCGVWMGEIASF